MLCPACKGCGEVEITVKERIMYSDAIGKSAYLLKQAGMSLRDIGTQMGFAKYPQKVDYHIKTYIKKHGIKE